MPRSVEDRLLVASLFTPRFISPPPSPPSARLEITVRVVHGVPCFSPRGNSFAHRAITGTYGLILMHPRSPRAVAVANTRERDPVSRKREEERRRRLPIRLRRGGVSRRFQNGPVGNATPQGCSCCQTRPQLVIPRDWQCVLYGRKKRKSKALQTFRNKVLLKTNKNSLETIVKISSL